MKFTKGHVLTAPIVFVNILKRISDTTKHELAKPFFSRTPKHTNLLFRKQLTKLNAPGVTDYN